MTERNYIQETAMEVQITLLKSIIGWLKTYSVVDVIKALEEQVTSAEKELEDLKGEADQNKAE